LAEISGNTGIGTKCKVICNFPLVAQSCAENKGRHIRRNDRSIYSLFIISKPEFDEWIDMKSSIEIIAKIKIQSGLDRVTFKVFAIVLRMIAKAVIEMNLKV